MKIESMLNTMIFQQRIIEGLVAIEDTQFFEHHGINPDAISRACYKIFNQGDL